MKHPHIESPIQASKTFSNYANHVYVESKVRQKIDLSGIIDIIDEKNVYNDKQHSTV